MQNELVKGIGLCFFLLLFISFLLLLCFLWCTVKGMVSISRARKKEQETILDETGVSCHSQTSHLSSCLQMSNPQCEASCVCILRGTYLKLCACDTKNLHFYTSAIVIMWTSHEDTSEAFVPGNVVQWGHPKASDHSPASLLGQQFVPHHLFGFKRMLRLNQRR